MATAIKAVAEAAEDVRKLRTGNVFDRLSRGADVQGTIEQISTIRGTAVEDDEYEVYEPIDEKAPQRYSQARGYVGGYNVNASMMDSSTGMASDSASDNEGYGDVNLVNCKEMNGTETGTSRGYKVDDSFLVQSSAAQDTDALMHQARKKGNEQQVPSANAKHKIVNISVNVNTWKPPHYQPHREIVEIETRNPMQKTDTGAGNSNVRVMKENSSPLTVLGSVCSFPLAYFHSLCMLPFLFFRNVYTLTLVTSIPRGVFEPSRAELPSLEARLVSLYLSSSVAKSSSSSARPRLEPKLGS